MPPLAAYIFLIFSGVLQQVFPPYPGDTFLLFAGALSASGGLNAAMTLVCYASGTLISSLWLYEVGYKYGDRILRSKAVRKVSPQRRIQLIDCFIRFGAWFLVICKFVPGVNFIAIIISGAVRFERGAAYAGISFAALLHNSLLFMGGRGVGAGLERIEEYIFSFNKAAILAVVGVLAIGYTIYRVRLAYIRRRKE